MIVKEMNHEKILLIVTISFCNLLILATMLQYTNTFLFSIKSDRYAFYNKLK